MAMSAQQYLATLPQAEQDKVNASLQSSGSSLDQWYQAAVNAGDPRAVQAAGGQQTEGGTGNFVAPTGNEKTADWQGKRAPTPQELRQWAKSSGRSEDYARFSDAELAQWLGSHWDVGANSFKNDYGDLVDKPDERGPKTPPGVNGTGDKGGWDMPGGQGSGFSNGTGAGQAPITPVTNGSQLSMTGNPLQDMLINQFNTAQGSTADQGFNIFGLGEDRKVGGTGLNADKGDVTAAQAPVAQSLGGGGLWWGQGADTFGGFDASKKNSDLPASTSPAAPATPAAVTATPAPAPVPAAPFVGGGVTLNAQRKANLSTQPATMSGMMTNQFDGTQRKQPVSGQPPRFF
jgi:hypothetical protein